MKALRRQKSLPTAVRLARRVAATALLASLASAAYPAGGPVLSGLRPPDDSLELRGNNVCELTTRNMLRACQLEALDDSRRGVARCLNLGNKTAKDACDGDNQQALNDGLEQCEAVEDARDDVCDRLGPAAYDPVINPANFVATITNPYRPSQPGRWWEYRKTADEGLERIRVEVLRDKRRIQGVLTTTLRDRVWLNGALKEDTTDWAAQDRQGNVWYFGEIVQNFENGLLASLDGSFEAGKNFAKAGLLVQGTQRAGAFFRQEFDLGNAEDVVEVLDVNAQDPGIPFRNSLPVLKTRDTTPLSPDGVEFKFYVSGIGLVLEIKPDTGERLELVDYGPR